MKQKIFTLAFALFATLSASAQLPAGSVAPDFTLKDLNGNTYNLYSLLASGKTVFIDFSAAWCGPCWSYHNTGSLENLYKQHGPAGAANVDASTTNDVMVLFIEGEPTNTRAQLYGPATAGTYATQTQGNWVAGTPYPIIDTDAVTTRAYDAAWNIGYFPTIYMVCRDRLVQEVGTLTTAELYAAAQKGCPTYAPSSTFDAKVVPYSGNNWYFCNAAPTVKFQNYSETNTITAATIKVYSGSTLATTYNWTGSVAPYGIATVAIPTFAATSFGPYKYDVTVTGDTRAANDVSADSLFKVYVAANAGAVPTPVETFESMTSVPFKYGTDGGNGLLTDNTGAMLKVTGSGGAPTTALAFYFYQLSAGTTTEFVYGNFNTQSATNVALDFDLAYTQYTVASPENDKLEILVSTDCGATWSTAWSKSGTTLQTRAADGKVFLPTSAGDWRHESVLLTPYKSANMIVKFKGYSDYGNFAFLDNMKMTPTLSVSNVIAANSVSVYPNPAKEAATLQLTLSKTTQVVVTIMDAAGRTVATVADATMKAGAQTFNIPTATLAAGLYNIAIRTDEGTMTQRLSVVK